MYICKLKVSRTLIDDMMKLDEDTLAGHLITYVPAVTTLVT